MILIIFLAISSSPTTHNFIDRWYMKSSEQEHYNKESWTLKKEPKWRKNLKITLGWYFQDSRPHFLCFPFSNTVHCTWHLHGLLAVIPQGMRALLHHVNMQHIPAWAHSASLADRSTAQLLSANWITTLFPAPAADILPPVSSKIRWSPVLSGCPAPTDLMAQVGLGKYAALTEWG